MTIQEFLTAQGLTSEEIAAVVGNEKQAKAMSAALRHYEDGLAAKTAADAEKAETTKFWETKTADLEKSVGRLTAAEKRAAAAEAEAARVKAYNKSLADQGYDVPKIMYEGETPKVVDPEKPFTRQEATDMLRGTAPDLVTLTALQARYQYLLDKPYIDIDKDFLEAQKAGKSLSDFVSTKYDFAGKESARAQKADQERIDKIVSEQVKVKEAELAEKYGSNPETRISMPSKFDKLQKDPGFKSDSWKSQEGRNANRAARLKKFENIPIQ
jgi:hypothetical protein